MPAIRLSYAAAVILQALAQGYRYGFDVMDFVGLPSGTVYPALRRLEAAGLVRSQWEKPEVSQREARPARKYYDLTRSGRDALVAAADRYRLPAPEPASAARPARAKG
jgi:DNA-binding PadR family transcriptional regulator